MVKVVIDASCFKGSGGGSGTSYDDTAILERLKKLENRTDNFVNNVTVSRNGNKIKLKYIRVDGTSSEVEFDDNDTLYMAYDDSNLRSRVEALEAKPDKDTVYDDSVLKARVEALEAKPEVQPYNDKPLADRVSALEAKPDKDTIYDDSDLKDQVNDLGSSVANVLHEVGTIKTDSEARIGALEAKTDKDNQELQLEGKVLSITNGNSVTLPDGNTRELTEDKLVKLPENRVLEAYKTPISVLNGKKILFIGDSLTEVNYRTSRGYVESLKQDKGIEAINHGSSGYGYSTKDENFMGADIDSADAFVIALGINDFGNVSGYNLPLETVLKTVKRMLSKASMMAGDRPFGVITPMPYLKTVGDKVGAGGYTLNQLRDGIISVVKEVETEYNRSIPVLKLTDIDPLQVAEHPSSDNAYLEKYFKQGNIRDEEFLHPNDTGWKVITPYISYWLENTFKFATKKPDEKTLQVTKLPNGNLEINTTTLPIKFDSTETNAYNKNKFRIPTFGDGSNIYSLRGEYTDKKTVYKLTFTINDYFTFDTDYHPHATDYAQLFYYFDVDSITTNPTEYLATHNVKSVMAERNCDEKEATYILNLIKLYKEYQDRQLFTEEENTKYKLLNKSYVPFPMKVTIEKR
jgi:lipase/acylhydrolase domain protein|nr:MAG TPA: hypothetical protein [Caudoviricetes sp.]